MAIRRSPLLSPALAALGIWINCAGLAGPASADPPPDGDAGVKREEQKLLPAQADKLSSVARQVLFQHCARCHQGVGSEGGEFNVLDVAELTSKEGSWQAPLVIAGDAKGSYLLERIVRKQMPPPRNSAESVSAEEIATLTAWINAGAPAFSKSSSTARELIRLNQVVADAFAFLEHVPAHQRAKLRFITFHHLSNNPRLEPQDLRLHRAALSKTVNSLSRQPRMALPRAVAGPSGLMAIDLAELGWDEETWNSIARTYPYGLSFDRHPEIDAQTRQRWDEIVTSTDTPLPLIRGDWLIAHATRPPLYHRILKLPQSSQELQSELDVDLRAAFADPTKSKLMRAAFSESGVSEQNRAIDRLPIPAGAYWQSYDFAAGAPRGRLIRFPLGPLDLFEENAHPFGRLAFVHDGGEIIFNLPNGLQAYLLVDAKGKRIDEGPVNIVSDALRTSGTPAIVNGLSCMACHKHGVLPLTDSLRETAAVFDRPLEHVQELFAPQAKWDETIKADREKFLTALDRCMGPFLAAEDRAQLARLPEPISEVTRLYGEMRLTLDDLAAELDMKSASELPAVVGLRNWKGLGLEPLRNGGFITREQWEAGPSVSLMQEVANHLGYSPVKLFGKQDD